MSTIFSSHVLCRPFFSLTLLTFPLVIFPSFFVDLVLPVAAAPTSAAAFSAICEFLASSSLVLLRRRATIGSAKWSDRLALGCSGSAIGVDTGQAVGGRLDRGGGEAGAEGS